jgi:putative ABC transport system permease protein
MSTLFRLAARNLWRNRRRTLVALAALAVGSWVVVLLEGFRNGVVDLMSEGMVKAQVGAFQVHRAGFVAAVDGAPLRLAFEDAAALRARIRAVPGVADLAPRMTFGGMASTGTAASTVWVLGVDPEAESRVFPLARRFVAGRTLADTDLANGAVLGLPLMKNLRLEAGGSFTVTAQSPEGQTNALDQEVVGWLPFTDPFSGKRLMAIRLDWAQQLVRAPGQITEYAVQIRDLRRLDETAARVRAALGPEFEVHTWLELQPLFRDMIRRQELVLSSVAGVLLMVAIAGIVNVMAMAVWERVREIGTSMALGMRRRQILALFVIEGGMLGLWGSAAGAALGWAMVAAAGVQGIPFKAPGSAGTMPLYPRVAPAFLAAAVAVALAGALLAAFFPALRAARLRPVEALRSV